jgi:hypothetical protein
MTPFGLTCLFGMMTFCMMFTLGWRATRARDAAARRRKSARLQGACCFAAVWRRLRVVRCWREASGRQRDLLIDIANYRHTGIEPADGQDTRFLALPTVAVRLPTLSIESRLVRPRFTQAAEPIRLDTMTPFRERIYDVHGTR